MAPHMASLWTPMDLYGPPMAFLGPENVTKELLAGFLRNYSDCIDPTYGVTGIVIPAAEVGKKRGSVEQMEQVARVSQESVDKKVSVQSLALHRVKLLLQEATRVSSIAVYTLYDLLSTI